MSPHSSDFSRRRLADASAALREYRRLSGDLDAGIAGSEGSPAEAVVRAALAAADERIYQLEAELAVALETLAKTASTNTTLQAQLAPAAAAIAQEEELRRRLSDAENRASSLQDNSTLLEAEAVRLDALHRAALRATADAEAKARSIEEALRRDLLAANAALDRAAMDTGAEAARSRNDADDLRQRLEAATARLQSFELEKRLDLARGSGDAAALHIELQRAMASAAAVRRELAQTREEAAVRESLLHREMDAMRSGGRIAELEAQLLPLQERAAYLTEEVVRLDQLRKAAEHEAAVAMAEVRIAQNDRTELARLKGHAAKLEKEAALFERRGLIAEADAAKAAGRAQKLALEIEEAHAALGRAGQDAESARTVSLGLEENNLQLTRHIDDLSAEIARAQERQREVDEANVRAKTIEDTLRRQLLETKETLERALSRAARGGDRLAAAEELIESLKTRMATLEGQFSREDAARRAAESAAAASAAEVGRLQALLSAAEDAVAPLAERAKSLNDERSELAQRLVAAEAAAAITQAAASAAQAEQARAAGVAEELRIQLSESQTALEVAASQAARSDERLAQADSELANLQHRFTMLEIESMNLAEKMSALETESTELRAYGRTVEEALRRELSEARTSHQNAVEQALDAQAQAAASRQRAEELSAEAERQREQRHQAEGERSEIAAYGRAVEDSLRRELEEAQLACAQATKLVGAAEATVTALKERAAALEEALALLDLRLKAAENAGRITAERLTVEKTEHFNDAEALRRELDGALQRGSALDDSLAQLEVRLHGAEGAVTQATERLRLEKQTHATEIEALKREVEEAAKKATSDLLTPALPASGMTDEWPPTPVIEGSSDAPTAPPDFSSPPVEPLLDPGWSRLLRLVRPPVEAAYAHLRRLSATALTSGQKALLRLSAASLAQASDALGSVELSLEEGPSAANPTSIVPALEAALAAWEPTFRRRGVTLSREWSASLPAVTHDPRELRVLIYHVLRNVLEAVPHGARLAVRGSRIGDGGVRIEFIDDGPGFPAPWLERRFEPFASPRRGRAGLGLALVRRTLRRWGADAEAANGSGGRGARLTWVFPAPALNGMPES